MVTVPGLAVADDRLLVVPALLNGRQYVLIVDTGATDIALLPEIISDELRLPLLPEPIDQLAVGRSEIVRVPRYRLDRINVGGIMVEGLDAIPLDWPRQLDVHGILGMNFLNAFPRFCLDLAALALELISTNDRCREIRARAAKSDPAIGSKTVPPSPPHACSATSATCGWTRRSKSG